MAYPLPRYPWAGPVDKFTAGNNQPISRVVIHCTVGSDAKGSTGTAAYFRSEAARGSAHFITDANLTIQCANLNTICWHAPPNDASVGVEMCCSLSNEGQGHWERADHIAMMDRTAKLTAELCLHLEIPIRKLTVAQVRAGLKGICGHVDVSNAFGQSSHWDPGPYFPWSKFIGMTQAWARKLTEEDEMTDEDFAKLDVLLQKWSDRNVKATGQQLAGFKTDVQAMIDLLKEQVNNFTRSIDSINDAAGAATNADLQTKLTEIRDGLTNTTATLTTLSDRLFPPEPPQPPEG